MPKKLFKLPINLEIERLKRIYKPTLESFQDNSVELQNNFYKLVLPSLANPRVVKEISNIPRYFCLFESCKAAQKSFASKQKYVQHLQIQHDQELPKGGSFISPNDKSTQPGGFCCSNCGHHYCRREHLNNHIKTNVHSKNASVMHENPLVLKEIEVEKRLAIEYYPIDSKKVNINENDSVEPKEPYLRSSKENLNDNLVKKEDKLPISKKSNFVSEKVNSFVQKLTSYVSMMTQDSKSNSVPIKSKVKKRSLMSSGLSDDNDDDCIPTKESREDSYIDREDEILINVLTKWEKSNKF
ncbi:unnamed protein product [Brachionus calyciflorus]|uniref:C2H2-type domain-containing protein n=1 Tax=Brachionus calyciflorus TaxID=104777 RepID=A0A814LR79_9BILA|nr:unnamed protein product [Brachionus calyciflorus]